MTNKIMSKRDEKVKVRNSLISMIYNGIEIFNSKGNREPLAGALKFIHNHYQRGYTVNLNSNFIFDFFRGRKYTKHDGMIVIEEDGKPLMVLLQLLEGQCEGEWRVFEVDEEDFKYDADLRAEAQAEMDAENAHEAYYDYKVSFDDPRSY